MRTAAAAFFAAAATATATTPPLQQLTGAFHVDPVPVTASRCDSSLDAVGAPGDAWTAIATQRPSSDGFTIASNQAYQRDNVGGQVTVVRRDLTVYRFALLILVVHGGTPMVLSLSPQTTDCAALPEVTPHTYASTWKLAPENGAPPSATGTACVGLAPAGAGYDVTVTIGACVPARASLATSAQHGVLRNFISAARFRTFVAHPGGGAAAAAARLRLAPLVLAADTGGGAVTLRRDGRPARPCPALAGSVGAVWELAGEHRYSATVVTAAGSATATTRVRVRTVIAGVPVPFDGAAGDAAAASRLAGKLGLRRSQLVATLQSLRRAFPGRAAPSLCPRPRQ